jgi:hypothetical protein
MKKDGKRKRGKEEEKKRRKEKGKWERKRTVKEGADRKGKGRCGEWLKTEPVCEQRTRSREAEE